MRERRPSTITEAGRRQPACISPAGGRARARVRGASRLAEIALCAGILAVAAVVTTAFLRFRQQASAGSCQCSLANIGRALSMYASENDDRLPPLAASCPWPKFVARTRAEKADATLVVCPAVRPWRLPDGWADYALNAYLAGARLGSTDSQRTVLACDFGRAPNPWITSLPAGSEAARRHRSRTDSLRCNHANYCFVDGHVRSYRAPSASAEGAEGGITPRFEPN